MIIEKAILMWWEINAMTNNRDKVTLNTINISGDESIEWNGIKTTKTQPLKPLTPTLIEKFVTSRNDNHPHQAHRTPFTIESLRSLIGKDIFTSFSQELLNRTANIDQLKVSATIKNTSQPKSKTIILKSKHKNTISLDDFKVGYRNGTNERLPRHQEETSYIFMLYLH